MVSETIIHNKIIKEGQFYGAEGINPGKSPNETEKDWLYRRRVSLADRHNKSATANQENQEYSQAYNALNRMTSNLVTL